MAYSRQRQPLEAWIREVLNDTDKGKPTALTCVHITGNGAVEKEVYSIKFGSKNWEPKELSEIFQGKADGHAQDLPGIQYFAMLIFYEGSGEPGGKRPFVVNSLQGADQDSLFSEGPTPSGVLGQMMRTYEAHAQLNFRKDSMMFSEMNNLIRTQSDMLSALTKENFAAVALAKEVIFQQAENKHEHRMKEIAALKSAEDRKKLITYLPALVNTLTGKEIFPQSTADTALVETAAQTITEEQATKLAEILPPELVGPLMARLTDVLKKRREEKESIEVEADSEEKGLN